MVLIAPGKSNREIAWVWNPAKSGMRNRFHVGRRRGQNPRAVLCACGPVGFESACAMVTPDDKPTIRDRLRALGLAIGLVALGWLAIEAPNPPAPLSVGSPPGEFSAERALTHLRVIADRVHPIDSPANAAVCRYLADQLKAVGCEVETQPFTYGQQGWRGSNVLARLPGRRATNEPAAAVMLVCHHDSVRMGPGASDDGVAVAALLETARALKAGPVLRHDIILLLTDGEEVPEGLPGAQAFVKSSPWWQDVGCVFNFDARGVSGPELMYETSAGNGPLIREFSRAVRRPVANSLMCDVYRHMPNDTDFTVFRQAGMPGLNFAFIGGVEHYHQPSDDLAHVSLSTLQHAGDLALGLARHFGEVDLTGLRGADAVYFDLLGRVLVRYPGTWAFPLALAGTVLFLVVAGQAWKRGEVSGWKLAGAALMWGLILLLVFALVLGALWLQAAAVARAWKWTLPVTGLAVAAVTVFISWIRSA